MFDFSLDLFLVGLPSPGLLLVSPRLTSILIISTKYASLPMTVNETSNARSLFTSLLDRPILWSRALRIFRSGVM